jgi:hypothetical protein
MRIYFNDPISMNLAAVFVEDFINRYGDNKTQKDSIYMHPDRIFTYVKKVKSGYSVSQWRQAQ